jgi:oligoendopeptidase F
MNCLYNEPQTQINSLFFNKEKAMAKERAEIPAEDRWNVEALYPSLESWYKEFESVQGQQEAPHWPHIEALRGHLGESPSKLAKAFEEILFLDRRLSRLYTYAHLRHDEDLAEMKHKEAFEKITMLCYLFKQQKAWFEPEILSLSQEIMDKYLASPLLKEYKLLIERLIRMKEHMLDAKQEELLALSGQAMDTSHKAFSAFSNADLKFPDIEDGKGVKHELTHASYLKYLREEDRVLRKAAFTAVHRSFAAYENMLAELINGLVQKHVFITRARKFPSCMEAALFPNEIDPKVYHSLIAAVRERLPVLHRYMQKRKEWLEVDELHLYDLHVPLVPGVKIAMEYEQGAREVVESTLSLGKEYQETLEKGLFIDRWVDRYENARKRSGAYSSGCYDSMPYILMNYQGVLNDVMTLAHECGHSMHSLYSRKTQSYPYADYAIFVAEVASTFNEELMIEHLMKKMEKPEEKAYLINQRIDDIRATFFRQTMFAEFELKIHELAEKGVPITAGLLKQLYRQLNQEYFGSAVVLDEEIDWEWARIPHFYYNFYVYQYATGISAAFALYEKNKMEGEPARRKYLRFLSSGSSKGPLDVLAEAGIDMREPKAVEAIMQKFDNLVSELDAIFKHKANFTKRLPKIPASSMSF